MTDLIATHEPAPDADWLQRELHPLLERLELQHEWHRIGFIAIDVPPDADIATLMATLTTWSAEGVLSFEFS
jgi:hypothetical protein